MVSLRAVGTGAVIAGWLALGLMQVSTSANAATSYTVDTKLGEQLLGNSGAATEKAALASFAGVDASTLTLDLKVDHPTATKDDSGNWFIDIAPATPGFFLLKFGIGGISATADTFFFQNIGELTKLVFTSAQVQGIIEGCNNCNAGRLSHYTSYNATVVPVPAALPLLASGLGMIGWLGWRRKKQPQSAI